jgi:disulfide bond formation protein DsbB
MICPNCSSPTLPEQKFCRSCGAGLQLTTNPLSDIPVASEFQGKPSRAITGHQPLGSSSLPWAFIIMFLGVAIGVVGKMVLHNELVTVVGVLLSLLGMFLTAYPYLSSARPPRSRAQSSAPMPASQPEVLTATEINSLPEAGPTEFIPSVTERTTNLLQQPRSPSDSVGADLHARPTHLEKPARPERN